MHALGRRFLAAIVDAIIALMGAALILTPFARLADPIIWQRFDPIPLLWALLFVFLSIIWQGNTPGKKWLKLHVAGTGCIICRELRRSGWFLVIGAAQLLESVTFDWLGFVGMACAGLWILWLFDGPVLRKSSEFPHNSATGFHVTDRH